MLAAMTANASDFIIGTTFGEDAYKLTTFEYRLSEQVTKNWGKEVVFGVVTGFEDLDQNTDVKKYSLALGANLNNGDAKIAGGYVMSYIDAKTSNAAYPGWYASVDFKITKSWFAQVKYTNILDTDVAEGWQGGIGFKF